MSKTRKERIDTALEEVTAAENALGDLLKDLRAGVRAEKVTITQKVEQAFTRLREGRAELAKVRAELEAEEKG